MTTKTVAQLDALTGAGTATDDKFLIWDNSAAVHKYITRAELFKMPETLTYAGTTLAFSTTGSGSMVLSTSPTLVTPLLGTPTSVTLTNATGLPLTTGVTGTLPVANGGTGVTTSTGSGNNALSASPTFTGTLTAALAAFTGDVTMTQNTASTGSLVITNTGVNGANLRLTGDGATTPSKTIRATGGALQIINNAYSAAIFSLGDTGAITVTGALTYGGVTLANSCTGTGSMALSVSPSFSGTLTAAAATFTTLGATGNVTQTSTALGAGGFYQYNGTNYGLGLSHDHSSNVSYFDTMGQWTIRQIDAGYATRLQMAATTGAFTFSTATTFSAALTYGGVTLANSVSGTGGSMVLSASPTFTGAVTAPTLNTTSGGLLFSGATALNQVSSYTILYTSNAVAAVQAGNASDPQTYYNNGTHQFRNAAGTLYATINSTGLNVTGTGVFSGSVTASSYITSSDVRLKEQIELLPDAGAMIDALEPKQWRWKADGSVGYGFIAQELVKVIPDAVVVGDDDPDKSSGDEGFRQWARDDTKLIALMIVELKALRSRVKALEI